MGEKIKKVLIIGEENVLSKVARLNEEMAKEREPDYLVQVHQTTTDKVATMMFRNEYQKTIQICRGFNFIPDKLIYSEIFKKGAKRCWFLRS